MENTEILRRLISAGSIFLNHTAVYSFINFAKSQGVIVSRGKMICGGQWLYLE